MGNCLVQEQKPVRVMKTDGKILEYQPPIKVQQVLSDFSDHTLSDTFPGFHHFQPDAKLLPGKLYYLIPVPSTASQKCKKKKVRFSIPEANHDQGSPGGVRIKLIISKQELQQLIQKQGVTVLKDTVSRIDRLDADDDNRRGWKPVLEGIDEVN